MTAEELRQRRAALGIPQARFALLLGVHPAALRNWERDDGRMPTWVEEKVAEIEATRWPRRE